MYVTSGNADEHRTVLKTLPSSEMCWPRDTFKTVARLNHMFTMINNWCSSLMTGYICHLPIERSLHITEGVAKHAKTSSVQVKCVRWGNTIDWPLHWPHMYTWPLWVLAADVCVEWQAAISMILSEKPEKRSKWTAVCESLKIHFICCDGLVHLSFSVMIWTGLSWLFLLPVPSCPYVLAPQAYSKPSSVNARQWA